MGASGSSIKLTFCNNEFQDIKTLISSQYVPTTTNVVNYFELRQK